MADTYVDTIAKLQTQGLQTLKTVQDAQLGALGNLREIVGAMAPVTSVEALPTAAQLTELGNTFATQLFEQQKSYATALAGFFSTVQKDATEATTRYAKTATGTVE